jgi:cell division septal protein FtsQ
MNKNKGWRKAVAVSYTAGKKWLNQQENKGLKLALIILLGCVITMLWYLNAQFKEFRQLSQVNFKPFLNVNIIVDLMTTSNYFPSHLMLAIRSGFTRK